LFASPPLLISRRLVFWIVSDASLIPTSEEEVEDADAIGWVAVYRSKKNSKPSVFVRDDFCMP